MKKSYMKSITSHHYSESDHSRHLRLMQPKDEQYDDNVFQKLMGKDAAAHRKYLACTSDTITFNEAVAGMQILRDLHIQMDKADLDAYCWSDINLCYDIYEVGYLPDRTRFTIHPEVNCDVLKRLLELNLKNPRPGNRGSIVGEEG